MSEEDTEQKIRHVRETFTQEQFERLKAGKGDRSWEQAMMDEIAVDPGEVE